MFLRNRSLLLSSLVVTVLLLIGIGIVGHDALTIRKAEEVEEDTGKLLLDAERWLNHQEAIEVALRDYVLLGGERSLQTIRENRVESEEHILGMKHTLAEHQEDADSQIQGLLKYRDQHQAFLDEIIRLKQAGNSLGAHALLTSAKVNTYKDGTHQIIEKITQDLQDKRSRYNSVVSFNVLRGSFGFAGMALVMISAVWVGYAITVRTQRRNEELSAQLAFEATHDALTGLPNRRYLYDHLNRTIEMAKRHHHRLALMVIDLDGFKTINDTYGHDAGDLVLAEVARRFKRTLRTSDLVVRMGGDEFALVAEPVDQANSLQHLAQRLIDSLDESIEIQDSQSVGVSCSIGIAIFPDHASGLSTLFSAADQAMYVSKAEGKQQWRMA